MTVLRILSAVVALAAAFPAAAQVPAIGPYSQIHIDEDTMLAVAEGTKARSGSTGRITVVTLLSPDKSAEVGLDVIRVDAAYEFQCSARNGRATAFTAYDSNGAIVTDDNSPAEWKAIDRTTVEDAWFFVCDGVRPSGETTSTITQLTELYNEFLFSTAYFGF